MNDTDRLSSWLKARKNEMASLLEELVCIQSGSYNKSGVDRVGRVIRREMESIGFSCSLDRQKRYGDHLIARSPGSDACLKQILITGHMDTVFPEDTSFTFFKQDERHTFGPGVADMKGGLVVGIFALKALDALEILGRIPICFVFNSDEEVGSPSSKGLIRAEAGKAKVGLVLEAGGLNNEIVTGRKGNMSGSLSIEGSAGHAAFAGPDKASAVLELAHKTIEIEKMNRPEKGICANVGMVEGGIGPNTVAQHASARIDFRFVNSDDGQKLKDRINRICRTVIVPGTASRFELTSGRPPMPETREHRELFDRINAVAQEINSRVVPELRQGVSDANFIADCGIPVIDGLGPCGAKDHSEDEYILTQSLMDRTLLFAGVIRLSA